jgi:hypothetical protein
VITIGGESITPLGTEQVARELSRSTRDATRYLLAVTTWVRALTVLTVGPAGLGNLTGPGPIPANVLPTLYRSQRT